MLEIRQLAEEVGIEKSKIYKVVDGLNLEGFLLNKGGSKYELITANQ